MSDDVLLQGDRPALMVAHSLGGQLVAAWAAHSANTARVHGALLVAPPDLERDDMPPQLPADWGAAAACVGGRGHINGELGA